MLGNFGKFTLREKLAEGGMAEVFRATCRNSVGDDRIVAIKRLHRALCRDSELTEMLVDEFRIAIQLDHPGVCAVFDLGMHDEQSFIIMEYITGIDLQFLISQYDFSGSYIPTNCALAIIAETLDALHYAHTRRNVYGEPLHIVHRDVSPHNVMIDLQGRVKLVDFGIAKAKDRVNETRHGIIKGKYYYMSPEQAHGHHVDARTDVFAAGMVLYECIAGQSPYADLPDAELLKNVRRAGAPPVRKFRPDVNPYVEQLIARATARNPEKRFQSAAEFSATIYEVLEKMGGCSRQELAELARIVANPVESGENIPPMTRAEYRTSQESLVFELPSESTLAKLDGDEAIARKPRNYHDDEDRTRIYERFDAPPRDFGGSRRDHVPSRPPAKKPAPSGLRDPRLLWVAVALAVFLLALAGVVLVSKRGQPPATEVVHEPAPVVAPEQPTEQLVGINSTPVNASIIIDGKSEGTTPKSISLKTGQTYRIEILKEGFEPHVQELTVAENQSLVEVKLGESLGVIKFLSYPSGARISIEGDSIGRTPINLAKLETTATYTVTATLGADERTKKVRWRDGESNIKEVMFEFKNAPEREVAIEEIDESPEPVATTRKRNTPKKRTPTKTVNYTTKRDREPKSEESLSVWDTGAKKTPKEEEKKGVKEQVKDESGGDLNVWGSSKPTKKTPPKPPKPKKKKEKEKDEGLGGIW